MAYILGKKIGMTRVVSEDGKMVPVTIIQAEPNTVYQVKTSDKDGYQAIAVSFTGVSKKPKIREFRVDSVENITQGQEISVETFAEAKTVNVQGVSKGKGFQGGIKRHNFAHAGKTHGVKCHRFIGSTGAGSNPARVNKGKKMPGHMGVDTITIKNIPVMQVVKDENLLVLKGAIPGAYNSLVKIWSN
jgi:large subunit ribosomal protein L3